MLERGDGGAMLFGVGIPLTPTLDSVTIVAFNRQRRYDVQRTMTFTRTATPVGLILENVCTRNM